MGCAFILQSAADIRRKLQKAITGSQTPRNQLLNMAFAIFNNRDRSEKEDEFVQNKCHAQLLAVALGNPALQDHFIWKPVRPESGKVSQKARPQSMCLL